MTQIKDLPLITTVQPSDEFHIQSGAVDKRVSKQNILKEIQAEVDANTLGNVNLQGKIDNITSGIIHVGGGTLTANRVNVLTDGSTYVLPLANSVDTNDFIDIELPSTYSMYTPTVARGSFDNIEDNDGLHNDILFDSLTPISIRLYSDGSNIWRL